MTGWDSSRSIFFLFLATDEVILFENYTKVQLLDMSTEHLGLGC